MISLKDVHQTFVDQGQEIPILKGINVDIDTGEIYGIIGKSGAGKSTLLRCMALLEPPKTGSIRVDNKEFTLLSQKQLRKARTNFGIVFQDQNLLSSKTVFDNLSLPLEFLGYRLKDISSFLDPIISLIEIGSLLNLYPHQLTLEQKQKVAIARALASRPQVLFLDQPTTHLDSKTSQNIIALLKLIHQEMNLTLVIITQDIETIKTLCDRVAVLHKGSLHQEGFVYEFFSSPKSEIGKEIIRSIARLEIPLYIRRRLLSKPTENAMPLIRFVFTDTHAKEPLFAHIIQSINLKINIIQAHQEIIQNKSLSIMISEFIGPPPKIELAFDFLTQKHIAFEVLGYVEHSA